MSYPRRNAATQRFTLGAPRTFSVSRDGQRILFCRSTAGDDPVNRLWVIDLPETEPRLLVDPVALLGSSDIELTAAEKARRERAREAGGGIVTFTTHSDHGIVVFALNGALYKTEIDSGETVQLDTVDGAFDPRISPDGQLVAYYAAGQLRVSGVDGDRLVAGEGALGPIEVIDVTAVGTIDAGDSRVYRLVDNVLELLTEDHSLVEALVTEGRITTAEAKVHPQRNVVNDGSFRLVPKIGDRYLLCSDDLFNRVDAHTIATILASEADPNVATRKLIDAANQDGSDSTSTEKSDASITWGAAEFVAAEEMGRSRGFWWSPDSTELLVARVDTSQVDQWYISEPVDASIAPRSLPYPAAGTTNATVDLFIVGLDGTRVAVDWSGDEFEYLARAEWTTRNGISLTVQPRDQKTTAIVEVDAQTGDVSELQRHTDPGWSELVTGAPQRFGDNLITVADDHQADTRRLYVNDAAVSPPGMQIRSIVSVSGTHVIVGATDDATELHVHEIPLDGSAARALTTTPGIHRCVASGGTRVITSSTMLDTRSTTTVDSGELSFEIESFAERPDLDFDVNFYVSTERALNSAVITPANHDGGLLPVLLDPYGGPHALRVQKARSAFSASQWFADQGFVVIVTDGSGTPARGPKFEQEVLGNMADPVLDDQVATLHALAKQYEGLMDLTRVGIRGWSFGGYLAALAVMKRPDVFHAGIAGAPVTDWLLYDTHYTERYLGHPATDADAYERTDLIPLAPQLKRALMLIHGLADDNVVSAHTFKLSRALLEAGRPHQVLPLSGVSHMTPQESVAENLLKLQVAFLRESLDY